MHTYILGCFMSAPFNVHDMRDRGRESCEVNELGRDEGGECDQSDRRTPSACEREGGGGGWIDVHVMKRIKTIVGSKPTH